MTKTSPTKAKPATSAKRLASAKKEPKRMIIEGQHDAVPDLSLVKLLVGAFDLQDRLLRGNGVSLEHIARQANITSSYATRLLRLSFLAPQIVRDILNGRHSPILTARQLMLDTNLPLAWTEQAQVIGNW